MSRHCQQRLEERYDLELVPLDLVNLVKLLKTKYYILIEQQEAGRKLVLTRYRGKYIVIVTDTAEDALITALPYLARDLEFVNRFVKEFD